MRKKLFKSLYIVRLRNDQMYELIVLLLDHVFTPQAVQVSGLSGSAFNDFKKIAYVYIGLGKDNPVQFETAELKLRIIRLRKLMTLFGIRFRSIMINTEGAWHEEAKMVLHAAAPFIKDVYKMTQTALLANAKTLISALSEPDIAERAAHLELAPHLHLIHELMTSCQDLILLRADKLGDKKIIGSPTKHRRELESSLKFLLHSIIPALYSMAADNSPQKAALKDLIFHINAAFDAFHTK
jgi:hypothetical protein